MLTPVKWFKTLLCIRHCYVIKANSSPKHQSFLKPCKTFSNRTNCSAGFQVTEDVCIFPCYLSPCCVIYWLVVLKAHLCIRLPHCWSVFYFFVPSKIVAFISVPLKILVFKIFNFIFYMDYFTLVLLTFFKSITKKLIRLWLNNHIFSFRKTAQKYSWPKNFLIVGCDRWHWVGWFASAHHLKIHPLSLPRSSSSCKSDL